MWRVFKSIVRCWRASGILLWYISLLKPDITKAMLQNLWLWDHACHCRQFFYVQCSRDVFGLHGKKVGGWIIPIRFYCMRSIKFTPFCEDKFTNIQRFKIPREIKKSFVQIFFFNGACRMKDRLIILFIIFQNTKIGEAFYTNFGSDYSFPEFWTHKTYVPSIFQIPFIIS